MQSLRIKLHSVKSHRRTYRFYSRRRECLEFTATIWIACSLMESTAVLQLLNSIRIPLQNLSTNDDVDLEDWDDQEEMDEWDEVEGEDEEELWVDEEDDDLLGLEMDEDEDDF